MYVFILSLIHNVANLDLSRRPVHWARPTGKRRYHVQMIQLGFFNGDGEGGKVLTRDV